MSASGRNIVLPHTNLEKSRVTPGKLILESRYSFRYAYPPSPRLFWESGRGTDTLHIFCTKHQLRIKIAIRHLLT